MRRDEGKVGKGREEGAWLQHLGLALVGRAHAVQRGPFLSSPLLPPKRCWTVLHYAWAACARDPHTG